MAAARGGCCRQRRLESHQVRSLPRPLAPGHSAARGRKAGTGPLTLAGTGSGLTSWSRCGQPGGTGHGHTRAHASPPWPWVLGERRRPCLPVHTPEAPTAAPARPITTAPCLPAGSAPTSSPASSEGSRGPEQRRCRSAAAPRSQAQHQGSGPQILSLPEPVSMLSGLRWLQRLPPLCLPPALLLPPRAVSPRGDGPSRRHVSCHCCSGPRAHTPARPSPTCPKGPAFPP